MEIKQDSYRYVNWVLFVFAAIANSIPTQAFSSISPTIAIIYNVTEFQANLSSLFYPISYVFLILPANYILDKKGLKTGTLICQICMILGLSVRLLINVNFYIFSLGTFFCSLGFCFMISAANKFANIWFPKNQIFLVSTTCIFSLFASDAIGTFLSSAFIKKDATKEIVFNFFLWESLSMIAIHILMALFFKGKPASIQNYASATKRDSFKSDIKTLFKNKNYRNLFLSMTLIFGDFTVIYVFLPWITKTYGYETISNGLIIICANIAGCVGCAIVGLLKKHLTYKKICTVGLIGLCISLGLLWLSFQLNSTPLSYIFGGCAGFFAYPFMTTAADFATQTTFPVGEATSSGFLLFGGQITGVIIVIILSFIFTEQSLFGTRLLIIFLIAAPIIGLIFVSLLKEILKRQQYENSKTDPHTNTEASLLQVEEEH